MRLNPEKLRAYPWPDELPSEAVCARLEQIEPDRSTLCTGVTAALAELLPEPPQEGWLPALYAALCHGLFPDPDYRQPSASVCFGLRLLTDALQASLDAEPPQNDPLTDLFPLHDPEKSRILPDYRRFCAAVREAHFVETMRVGREVMPFDPASHTIGVRNVAVHMAELAAQAGLPVDVPLVAAAALCHDIGKFACRGEDAARIPFLHYYYTWQWLSDRDLESIGHISANHSTWDLEFENLPIESLLLIYADFRVRGTRENGRETVRIYTLSEAYGMIMSKLCNVTPAKKQRYELVYCKLRDFERFLLDRGVPSDLGCDAPQVRPPRDVALMTEDEALGALRDLTFDNNVRLMHTISTDAAFDLLLEQARGEKDHQRIRTYLRLFDEYNTYMTRGNKQKLLGYLYELLMSPQGDIRRRSARIMGEVLANSGPKYRKELPAHAPKRAMAPTVLALLDESVALWREYIRQCLFPDRRIAQKHALRIINSLKTICYALFCACDPGVAPQLAAPLVEALEDLPETNCFAVLDALCYVPTEYLSPRLFAQALPALRTMLQSGTTRWQLIALRCLAHLRPLAPLEFLREASVPLAHDEASVRDLRRRLLDANYRASLTENETALIYLSNLKNAVHWTQKIVQIDMLTDNIFAHPETTFHTAMHLSNLLSVSEHLPVRERAGEALLLTARRLTVDQRNEIVFDLLRELENGQEQIARFIPKYLGRLLCTLPEKEIREGVAFLDTLLRSGTQRPATPVLRTLGSLIGALPADSPLVDDCLGLLLTGVAHYHSAIHQNALYILCHDVIGNDELPEALRLRCFLRVNKKLLAILGEPTRGQLTFFNRAAMLNQLYRFLVRHEVEKGGFPFPAPKPVAFFPGTFDPFSAGHKSIVREIRARGYEVYLAIDEFSWSKRTLPRLLRRKIVQMSAADQWDTYVFPDDLPINIAVGADLAHLRALFPDRPVFLVTGSDVIRNASAYRSDAPDGAAYFPHIVIDRPQAAQREEPLEQLLHGEMRVLSLSEQMEGISSTRIRDSIDKNLDISALVDPIVQAYIYEYGLYLRSPMFKHELAPLDTEFEAPGAHTPPELAALLAQTPQARAVLLRSRSRNTVVGWACGHTLSVNALFCELKNAELCSAVRRCTSGRLLMLDEAHCESADVLRQLLNELLVRALPEDHTYALCRVRSEELQSALEQLGFVPVPEAPGLWYVDMRAPMVLIQDVLTGVKQPHHDAPELRAAVQKTRPRLRRALTRLYPGKLLLCFDAELLNQALLFRVQQQNGVLGQTRRQLGAKMCVPYGKILADEVVPNTVTKTLHADKCFEPDLNGFSIVEYPGYSPLATQVRTLRSFRRPVLLVDDLLHNAYRINKLGALFRQEQLGIDRIIVGICSGRGRDLAQEQGLPVDCEYFIPNLHYWVNESLLYPFVGGDSVSQRTMHGRMLPSLNLILPYHYPRYFVGTTDEAVRSLSRTALENALSILRTLERVHQRGFNTALTLGKLGEALSCPRLPDRGQYLSYDFSVPASAYLRDDLLTLDRLRTRRDARGKEV